MAIAAVTAVIAEIESALTLRKSIKIVLFYLSLAEIVLHTDNITEKILTMNVLD